MQPQPSQPNISPSTPETMRVAIDALQGRMAAVEERLSGAGGPEPSIKEQLTELTRGREADSRVLGVIVAAVGESPDAATGREGSGMRKQLASLVEGAKKPTIASYFAAFGTAALAIYQILKGFGVVK